MKIPKGCPSGVFTSFRLPATLLKETTYNDVSFFICRWGETLILGDSVSSDHLTFFADGSAAKKLLARFGFSIA